MYKKLSVQLLFILSPVILSAQVFLKANEKRLYSFNMENKKAVLLSLDTLTNTMYYRLNVAGALSLEVEDQLNDDRKIFIFRHSPLGDYMDFTNGNFKYTIYEETAGDKTNIGLRSINLKTNSKNEMKGIYKTLKGNLAEFGSKGLVPVKEEK